MAPAIFSSNQLLSHFLSSGHATIWCLIQLVSLSVASIKMSEGDLYLEVFPCVEKSHRIWSEVSRDHKFSASAAGGGENIGQTAHIKGEKHGLPRCVYHFVRYWTLYTRYTWRIVTDLLWCSLARLIGAMIRAWNFLLC